MLFSEKCVVGPEKCFSATNLYQYIETVIKEASQRERSRASSNYAWLKSRGRSDATVDHHMEVLAPLIVKLDSESSTATAVKLDELTDERAYHLSDLLTLIKTLLLEQDSIRAMKKNIGGGKEMQNKKRVNKVQPELVGREATVSFIVESTI